MDVNDENALVLFGLVLIGIDFIALIIKIIKDLSE